MLRALPTANPEAVSNANLYLSWATALTLGDNRHGGQQPARQLHDDDRQVRRMPRGPLCRSR